MDSAKGYERTIADFRRTVMDLTGHTSASLARSETLGKQWDFADAVPKLEETFALLLRLCEADLNKVPEHRLIDLVKVTKPLNSLLRRITDYSPKATAEVLDFERVREKILTDCDQVAQLAFDLVSPLLGYLASCDNELASIKERKRTTVGYLEAMRSEIEHHVKGIKAESDQILQSLRDTSADVAVSAQASFFKSEAKTHSDNRLWWLTATVISGLVTLTFSIGAMLDWWTSSAVLGPSQVESSYEILSAIAQTAVPNLLVFGILSFATVWCGRNYKAESHNLVVNRHRLNALRVFPALVNATEDQRTKNAVLIGATQCIFAHQSSGFTQTDKDSSGTKATDFIRNLIPGSE